MLARDFARFEGVIFRPSLSWRCVSWLVFLSCLNRTLFISLLKVGFFFEVLLYKEFNVKDGWQVSNSNPLLKVSLWEDDMYCCRLLYCSRVRLIPSLGDISDLSIRKKVLLSLSGAVYIWGL